MQRQFFLKLQHGFRLAIGATIGTLNIAGIAASCWLAQSAPFDAALTRSLAFLTTPHRIGWQQFTIGTFILADYIPFAHPLLAIIHQSDAIAAIILSSLTTALLTFLMFALLQFNAPRRIAIQANQWEARRTTQLLQQLNESLQRIDLYTLPQADAAELMRQLDELLRQASNQRPIATHTTSWSPIPFPIA
ncbi:MAG: hypothetical protein SNJ57_09365 [Cyanobacteriota bacterium]